MRRIVMGGAVAAVAAVAFSVVLLGARSERAEVDNVQSQPTDATQAEAATDVTASVMKRLAVGQLAHANIMDQKLEALNQRLQAMEDTVAAPEAATSATDSESEEGAPQPFSEAALGDWMLDELHGSNSNHDWTRQAQSQVEQKLSTLPGVEVEAVECGDRYGRATFHRQDGTRPDVLSLLGVPPFDNEAFTLLNDDGSVSIYFTAPGVKIEELRSEAMAAASPM